MTCEEAKAARFSPKECLQAGFTWQEGKAAGFRSQFRDGDARYAPLFGRQGITIGMVATWVERESRPACRPCSMTAREGACA